MAQPSCHVQLTIAEDDSQKRQERRAGMCGWYCVNALKLEMLPRILFPVRVAGRSHGSRRGRSPPSPWSGAVTDTETPAGSACPCSPLLCLQVLSGLPTLLTDGRPCLTTRSLVALPAMKPSLGRILLWRPNELVWSDGLARGFYDPPQLPSQTIHSSPPPASL